MNKMLAALFLFFAMNVYAKDVFFAPYESDISVSLESRFDGFVWHKPKDCHFVKDAFNWNFKGYSKGPNGSFMKLGTSVLGSRCSVYDGQTAHERFFFERVGVDLQLGKYWDGIGAVRVGLMYSGPGAGADYWLIYRSRFKWLTTLEIAGNRVHGGYHYDDKKFQPFIKWLNRVFVYDTLFISFGVNHFAGSHTFENARTQGFLGFGSTI